MNITDILIKPIITEKSMKDASLGVYTFKVDKKTNKNSIKMAVEKQFKVNVLSVKTISVKGKTRRVGRLKKAIKTSDFKKGLVKIKEGQKIDIFETGK